MESKLVEFFSLSKYLFHNVGSSMLLEEDIFGSTKKSSFTYNLLQKPGGLIMGFTKFRGAKASQTPTNEGPALHMTVMTYTPIKFFSPFVFIIQV